MVDMLFNKRRQMKPNETIYKYTYIYIYIERERQTDRERLIYIDRCIKLIGKDKKQPTDINWAVFAMFEIGWYEQNRINMNIDRLIDRYVMSCFSRKCVTFSS